MPARAERAVIVGALRTPYGCRGGSLADWHPVDLSARVLEALVERHGLPSVRIDRVLWGCHSQVGAQAANIARRAVLAAGWPEPVAASTVDAHGASSMESVLAAAESVLSGGAQVVVAGGVEVASTVPLGASIAQPAIGRPLGTRLPERYKSAGGMPPPGLVAEELAAMRGLGRTQLDDWAVASVRRAVNAAAAVASSLLEVGLGSKPRRRGPPSAPRDEALARPLTASQVRSLPPAYLDGGAVTAANFALEGDGAAAVVVTTQAFARRHGLAPLATIIGWGRSGCSPAAWPLAATPATRSALAVAGLSAEQVGIWRVLESSAAAAMAWAQDLGVGAVNPYGGELATTCPMGAAGAGMVVSTLAAARGEGARDLAVIAACGELGIGGACVVELA